MPDVSQKKSFHGLVLTHFFTVINDNLYKTLLVFFLLTKVTESNNALVLSSVGFLFAAPFIVLAAVAGSLSDKYSKSKIIFLTRIAEIVCTFLGFLGFVLSSSVLGYITLFLMAAHTAMFAPAKFGILPEMVPSRKMTKCNGIMTSVTYLASIIGVFLASFLVHVSSDNFVFSSLFCFVFSIIGFFLSLNIKDTGVCNPAQKLHWSFVKDVIVCLQRCRATPFLVSSILLGGFFLLVGVYTQSALLSFVKSELGLEPLYGGYFFLGTAIGIGLGSTFIGYISGSKVVLGYVPFMALGMCIGFVFLYVFSSSLISVIFLLFALGFFGGGFIVPLHAFVQLVSPISYRGQNLAVSSLIDFVGVLCASGIMFLCGHCLGQASKTGFLIMGCLTLTVTIWMMIGWREQVKIVFVKNKP
ncbi:MAG: MFS transporter [Victivallaceae bacterium]